MNDLILPQKISCGYCDCSEFGNLSISPERTSVRYEIEYYLEDGRATYLNGEEIKITADRIIIAKQGDKRHSLLPFKTAFLKFEAGGQLAELLGQQPYCFEALHKKQIRELFHEVIAMTESENKDILLYSSKLFALLSFIIRDGEHKKRGTNYNYSAMHSAKKYIERNFEKRISTEEIAASVNLSESRFRYLFGIAYGISPHSYFTETRISAAKEMLWNTDIPITEIAEKCGFGCQQYLNDTFKKATGLSPGKYREQFAKKYTE